MQCKTYVIPTKRTLIAPLSDIHQWLDVAPRHLEYRNGVAQPNPASVSTYSGVVRAGPTDCRMKRIQAQIWAGAGLAGGRLWRFATAAAREVDAAQRRALDPASNAWRPIVPIVDEEQEGALSARSRIRGGIAVVRNHLPTYLR